MRSKFLFSILFVIVMPIFCLGQVGESSNDLPSYLRDRGTGIATSMFGTYIRKGEFFFYPFYEYYNYKNAEYQPEEFGILFTF